NRGALLLVLRVQELDVFDTHPHPRARLALIPFRQVDAGLVAGDAGELVAAPPGVGEPEHVDVVAQASRHVRDPQDRVGALESYVPHTDRMSQQTRGSSTAPL